MNDDLIKKVKELKELVERFDNLDDELFLFSEDRAEMHHIPYEIMELIRSINVN